jgi:nucleoid DNA-binding protein
LRPTKRNQIVKKTAQKLNVSEEIVDSVIVQYWKYVHNQMSQVTHTHIQVPNLGTFVVKPWSLENKIARLQRLIETIGAPKTLQQYSILKDKYDQLDKLLDLKEKVATLETEKAEIKNQRKNYEQHNSNLENQG